MRLSAVITWLEDFKRSCLSSRKADVQAAFAEKTGAKQARSVFLAHGYSFRFSEANTDSFSNVVLSLSTLRNYDGIPFIVCIVRTDRLDFRLANATFLKRISHSSHTLRTDNIRGSFLGHDIVDEFEGIQNRPENFDELFSLHSTFTWEENVERLVEATNAIVPRDSRFAVTSERRVILMEAPSRAALALGTEVWIGAERELSVNTEKNRDALLEAAKIDNVNIRGNAIEQLITGEVNAHRLDDLSFALTTSGILIVDIKTKLLERASAPKAYNIDKMLSTLSEPGNVFALFLIGIDATQSNVITRLASIFDPVILTATRVQHHWAGRSSRGVTQFTGNLKRIFLENYEASVDVAGGEALLRKLIKR